MYVDVIQLQILIIDFINKLIIKMIDEIPIQQMYCKLYKTESDGFQGYKVNKVYVDPIKQMKERETNIKKQKGSLIINRKKFKRGSFLTEYTQITKNNPPVGTYNTMYQWQKKYKTIKQRNSPPSYLEELIRRSKKQKFPGPGHYSMTKSLKEIQKMNLKLSSKKKKIERYKTCVFQDFEVASIKIPGPGNYNPREIKSKLFKTKNTPEEWKKKTKQKIQKQNSPLKKHPNMMTYNPVPLNYNIFGDWKIKRIKAKSNYWGKESRFDYDSEKGESKKDLTLGPGQYDLIHNWRGKSENKNSKHYFDSLSQNFRSIYY